MTDWDNLIEWFEDNEEADDLEDIAYLMSKVQNLKHMKKKSQKEIFKTLTKAFGHPVFYRYVRTTLQGFRSHRKSYSVIGRNGKKYYFRLRRFRK